MAFRTSKRNSSSQSETSDPLMFKLYRPSFQLKTTSSSSLQTKIHILKSNSSEKECSEPQWESSPWPSRIPVGRSNRWAMGNSWWARSYTRFLSSSENQGLVVGTMRYFRATTFVYTTKKEKSKLLSLRLILLFAVDRDTLEYFCRLQSNVFDAASCFKPITWYIEMHHVRAFFLCDVMTFSYYVMFIHNVFILLTGRFASKRNHS